MYFGALEFALTFLILLGQQETIFSQTSTFHGQSSGWITGNPEKSAISQMGVRYIPDFFIDQALSTNFFTDTEISLNIYGFGNFNKWDNTDTIGKIKLYRMWIRFSSYQFEIRAGLQKINFGSATLFRPLMWFDRIDPRDPLKITDGVYALLIRYYFINNANIWLWGLYGNKESKGWEIYHTEDNSIEFGGRLQYPLFNGEIALTYHHRNFTFPNFSPSPLVQMEKISAPENRYAIDGKWDVGIGLWFEWVLIHQNHELLKYKWRRSFCIGSDYTFDLGNGLRILTEYFRSENSKEAFGVGEEINFSAISFSYPIGLLDNLSCIIYYDWKNSDLYRLFNWQRKYDNWSFYLIGFWNPEMIQLYQTQSGTNPFTGRGFQFMIVFNH